MEFFLKLDNRFGDGNFVKDVAVEADRLGFDAFLMSDHYMWQTREPRDVTTQDTWITMTYLAGQTEHIRLGTQFTPIPFRSPAMLAKMLSTLDVLSNGRVILGVGAGWSQAEFEGYSEWNEPKIRVDKTKEGLELILKLWTEDEVTFDGKYYQTQRAVLEPKPLQKPYPMLFVSGRPRSYRMLRLAGGYGDMYNVTSRTATGEEVGEEEVQEGRDVVMKAARKADRAEKIKYAASLRGRRYDSEEYTRNIELAVEKDTQCLITYFPRDEDYKEYMKNFAKEVMPSFK